MKLDELFEEGAPIKRDSKIKPFSGEKVLEIFRKEVLKRFKVLELSAKPVKVFKSAAVLKHEWKVKDSNNTASIEVTPREKGVWVAIPITKKLSAKKIEQLLKSMGNPINAVFNPMGWHITNIWSGIKTTFWFNALSDNVAGNPSFTAAKKKFGFSDVK